MRYDATHWPSLPLADGAIADYYAIITPLIAGALLILIHYLHYAATAITGYWLMLIFSPRCHYLFAAYAAFAFEAAARRHDCRLRHAFAYLPCYNYHC